MLPAAGDGEVLSVDAAGYELGRSEDVLGFYDPSHIGNDYVLTATGQPTVNRIFAKRGRA